MKKRLTVLYGLLFLTLTLFAQGTGTVQGTVIDENGNPMIAATVNLKGTTIGAITDIDGSYNIPTVPVGEQVVLFTYVGFSPIKKSIQVREGETVTLDITMGEDALQMDEVIVTGTADQRTKLESSVAITTIDTKIIEQRNPKGTGELIAAVPGTFVDNSAGEVGAKVYARGLATGIRSQPGYHYVSLQEDGLPVLSTQFQFNIVDMYHRPDATVSKFEAIRGGTASTTSANAPGGIFNFISKEGTKKLSGFAKLQSALQGDFRSMFRADVNVGGPVKSDWYYNVGGFYRLDQGPRDLPYLANVGGQLKANIVRKHDNGSLKFYGKFLNDRVSQYEYVPVQDLDGLKPYKDFDLHTSTIYPELTDTQLPNGELYMQDSTATRSFDSNRGIATQNYAVGSAFFQDIGDGWLVKNNAKYSYSNQNFSQYAGNIVFDPELGLAEFFFLPTFSFNNFAYKDHKTGEVLYNKQAGIEDIDKIWAAAGFTVNNRIHDIIEQVSVSKEIGKHQLGGGLYFSHASAQISWDAEAIAATLEAQPRLLQVTHPSSVFTGGGKDFEFTNETGLIGEGASVYNRSKGGSTTFSLFMNDLWELNEKLNIDGGLRVENVFHKGRNENHAFARDLYGGYPILVAGNLISIIPNGADRDYKTIFDAGTRIGTGEFSEYAFNYTYVSGSFGVNYKFNDGLAVYGRGTFGNKAPELGYYISNFVNQPINKGFVEKIYMAEGGVKLRSRKGSIFLTGFYSRMNDVAFQMLVPGFQGIVIFTPSTFNKIQTIGTELEVVLYPIKGLNVRMIVTAQDPKFVEFDYYNLAGTADPILFNPQTGERQTHPSGPNFPGVSPYPGANGEKVLEGAPSDDFLESFDGNQLSNVPKILADITVSYNYDRLTVYANSRYTGKRMANRRNTLTLPAFAQFSAGIDAKINKQISASLKVSNLFNATGVMNFNGIGNIGETIEDLTEESIEANSTAVSPNPYFVRPVLPRVVTLSVAYEF